MDHPKPKHRGYYLLPNMMTMASLLTGFMGILWSIQGAYEMAAYAILASCVFDGLDGKLARLTNSASDFGVQLDSLADLVAFGVGPAILVYQWTLHDFGRLGIMASFLIIACGALRLARFNVQTGKISKKFFIGLPIPAAACTLAAFVFFAAYLPEGFVALIPRIVLVLAFLVSILMVSNVRYASFKDAEVIRAHRFSATVTALLIFVLVASEPKLLGFVFFIGYIISGLIYSYFVLPLRGKSLLRESSHKIS
ncbi:MAG: CDP-diacylglycerol--serine O-phosphatidyltransferase [Deltaproteobacteria bacterium]|nr:CDP-diacylglycerol--serine O-phosphatidyltransferase [Deltaproteobacteria bacterium]